MTLHIDRAGITRLLHDEAFPVDQWENAVVTRASQVEFDNDLRRWTVIITMPGCPNSAAEIAFSSRSRQACLRWENKFVNEALASLY